MKRLTRDDLLDLTAYEKIREDFRARIIELKAPRRVPVGDRLTFVFENRDTVLFQVQEMIRAERLVKDEDLQGELDVYNELIPGDFALSATLMVEIPDSSRIRAELDRLVGIDEYVWLDVGDTPVQAEFDPKQFEEDRISAVQYVRFPLGPDLGHAFARAGTRLVLRVDHPEYSARTELSEATRQSLSRDLEPNGDR